ncbi:MAG: hypothetical protein GX591_16925 [Planctomycetes bacterium]|nr:hypothetical protein [Planctomycetota bacterium]
MNRRRGFLLCIVTLGLLPAPAYARLGPSFSLDDNPAHPLTSPVGWIPGFGAEDPYGLGTFGGPLAPSPTLPAVPAMDADILEPRLTGGPVPAVDVGMSPLWNGRFGYVDAVSDNTVHKGRPSPKLHLGFSVDRISVGLPLSDVQWQAGLNQQPGDVFRTQAAYPHPRHFVGMPSPGMGYAGPLPSVGPWGTNFLMFDESRLHLTAGHGVGVPVGPAVMCPPIKSGTHDNVDAVTWQTFNDTSDDVITRRWLYFSVAPDERSTSGFGPCDIYAIAPGAMPWNAMMYAPAASMGLLDEPWEFEDNIDALVVWDHSPDEPNRAVPGMDYALFSLSHGSPSVARYGLSAADVFFTDFSGSFWLYAQGQSLGLFVDGGNEFTDNVDALEVLIPGDANLDGVVDLDDFALLKHYFGTGSGWLQGDFDGDGDVDLDDFAILKIHFGLGEG